MKNAFYFLLILPFLFFVSCKQDKDNASVTLLKKAQEIVDSEPAKAFTLLNSIHSPQDMDKEDYMQYILAQIRAKSKLSQDITGDIKIFEAEKYFEDKNDFEQAALAHFYAGIVSKDQKRLGRSLISFFKSAECAKKAADNKLSGIIFDYIGYIYFEQDLMDSTVVNYQKAINFYTAEKDTAGVLKLTNLIGRAYEHTEKLDSAYIYFNNAFQMAERLNDERYKSIITQNLAVIIYKMGEYDKAIGYYQSALNMQMTTEIQKRQIYLSLLKIYTIKQDANISKEYALKIEASLPEVEDLYTKKGMYAALTDYYKMLGDDKQALHFKELESATKAQIDKEEHPQALIQAQADYRIEQNVNQAYLDRMKFEFFLVLGIAFSLSALVLFVLIYRSERKLKKEMRRKDAEYELAKQRMREMREEFPLYDKQIRALLRLDDEDDKDDKDDKEENTNHK